MTWVDQAIVIFVVVFIVLLIWSKVSDQRIIDTVMEIKEIFSRLFT